MLSTYYCVRKSVWVARETQDFASLQGEYAFVGRALLRVAIRHTGFHLSRYSHPHVWNRRYSLEQEIQKPSGVKALKERRAVNKTRKPHWRLFHSPVTKPPPPDGRMPLAYREQLFSVHGHAGRTTRMYSDVSGYGRERCVIMYISHYQRITA